MSDFLDTLSSLSRDDWFFVGLMALLMIFALYGAFIELGPRNSRM